MQRFFDAHIYLANWGDAVLMLKLPSSCIDHKLLKAFSSQEYLSVKKLPEHWRLIWSAGESEDYERFAYHEGNDWIPRLAPLREELLRGDCGIEQENGRLKALLTQHGIPWMWPLSPRKKTVSHGSDHHLHPPGLPDHCRNR